MSSQYYSQRDVEMHYAGAPAQSRTRSAKTQHLAVPQGVTHHSSSYRHPAHGRAVQSQPGVYANGPAVRVWDGDGDCEMS